MKIFSGTYSLYHFAASAAFIPPLPEVKKEPDEPQGKDMG